MPIYRKCSHCGKRVSQGALCQCEIDYRKKRNKVYDKQVRNNDINKKYTDFYNSKEWRRMSEYIRNKFNGLCIMCLLEYNQIVPLDVVHHIESIRENWVKRLLAENLIPLCHGCHNSIDHINCTEEEREELRNLLKKFTKKYMYPGGGENV